MQQTHDVADEASFALACLQIPVLLMALAGDVSITVKLLPISIRNQLMAGSSYYRIRC